MTHSRSSDPAKRGIRWRDLHWNVVIGISAIHLVALLAVLPQFFSWSGLAVAAFLYWLSGLVGTTLAFHRLLSHRSFKTPKWFEYFVTCCGCLGWQGGPIQWVGMHRLHHAHSDDELDPHSPQHGFTWSHVLWCMHRDSGELDPRDAARDLCRDPGLRLIDRWFFLPQLLLIPLLYFTGQWLFHAGWSWVIWGVGVRTVVQYHTTWFVNSAAHTWGYRNYDTSDNSTNLWWLGILSGGEGWHNNHHAHQRSAAHGLRWFELDLTYWTIRALAVVGLAREIVLPRPDQRPATKKSRTRDEQAARDRASGLRPTIVKPELPTVGKAATSLPR